MEAIIFSDSHGNRAGMQQVLSHQVKSPEAVFFLGDGLRDFDALDTANASLYRVTGNCDWFSPLRDGKNPPTECLTALLGHTILLTHGHKFSVKSGEEHLLRHALAAGADIVLFGHTHRPTLRIFSAGEELLGQTLARPLYLFNPGSIASGYGGGSFGTLLLTRDTVLFSHGILS